MTLSHSNAVRNSLANVVGDAHDSGAGTATLVLKDGATACVTFDLDNPAFDTAPATGVGIIDLQSVPISATASADGDLDSFVTKDRDGTQILAGSVTAAGMGGDIEVTNTSVANGQDCSLEALTYEAAA